MAGPPGRSLAIADKHQVGVVDLRRGRVRVIAHGDAERQRHQRHDVGVARRPARRHPRAKPGPWGPAPEVHRARRRPRDTPGRRADVVAASRRGELPPGLARPPDLVHHRGRHQHEQQRAGRDDVGGRRAVAAGPLGRARTARGGRQPGPGLAGRAAARRRIQPGGSGRAGRRDRAPRRAALQQRQHCGG